MKLNLVERLMTNSPLRAFGQIHIEGPLLKKMAGRDRYPSCLEIGCGRGIGSRIIIEQFGAEKVLSIDIDPEQVGRARKKISSTLGDRIDFRVGDAMALDAAGNSFDAIFSFGVIHHMEDWRKSITEISRVLKPGGEFFFEELLRPFLDNFIIRRMAHHPAGGRFSLEEFKDALNLSGLELTALKRVRNMLVLGVARKRELPLSK